MASPVQAVSSLYGGFWNFELQDFCYMTNRYFPPADLIGELASSLPELVKSYPSTNRHLSSLVAAPLGLTHEQFVVGNGAAEIISVLSGLHVERLAVPIPTFDEYPNRAAVQGKPVSRYPTDAEFVLDVDGFIAHVAETGANAVVLIRPNNPSGTLIPKSSVVDMLQAFRRLDLVVIDESFLYFASPDWPQLSALSLIHEFPNLVIVNSMSKAYGVPGLRLGYAVSGDDAKYGIAKLGIHQQFSPRLWKATRRAKAFFWAGSIPVSALLGNCSTAVTPTDDASSKVAQCRQGRIWRRRNAPMSCASTRLPARRCNRSSPP